MAEGTLTATEGQKSSTFKTIDCPICLQKVNKPKYLPCLHTFCESCLQSHITGVTQIEKVLENFECPVCRQLIEPPKQGLQISEWARFFPTNHFIDSLSKSSEDPSAIQCVICERNDKQNKAVHKCLECAESLCDSCKQYHDSFGLFQNHKMINLENGEKTENNIFLPDMEEPCYLHKGKYIELYCHGHERVCCSICFATEHRYCEHVEELDKVKSKMKKEYAENNLSVLEGLSSIIDNHTFQKEEKLANLNAKQDEISDKLAAKVEETKALIDKLHAQFSKAFVLDHENNISNIEKCIRDLRGLKTTVQNAIKVTKIVLERGSEKQLLVSIAKHLQQILDHFEKFRKANESDVDKEYIYDFETLLQQITENGKIKEISILKKESEIVKDLSKPLPRLYVLREELPKTVPWINEPNMDSLQLQADQMTEFALTLSTPVMGSFLDEKSILMSGYELHRYGIDGQKRDGLLPRFPGGLVYLQIGQYGDEFVVSHGTKVMTYRIIQGREPLLISEIDLKEPVEGFCFIRDAIISVTRSSVKIYQYKPEVSIIFSAKERRDGKIGYVAASKTKDKFAYATGSEVVCRISDGTESFRYQHEKLKSPRGIAFDNLDNIYVCTKYFNSVRNRRLSITETGGGVIQVMKDGNTGRIIISDYRNACLISFCSNGELFLVSDARKCTIYKLSRAQNAEEIEEVSV